MKHKIAKILLTPLLLISIFVSANHHHKDLQPHYDCPICIFQLTSDSSDVHSNPIFIQIPEYRTIVPLKKESFVLTQKLQKPNQRAPPVSL